MLTPTSAQENIYKHCLHLQALSHIPMQERTLSDTAAFLWHLQVLGNNMRWLQLHHPEVAAGLSSKWTTIKGKETYLVIEGRLTGAHIDLLLLCDNHPFPDISESYDINSLLAMLETKNPDWVYKFPFPEIIRAQETLPILLPSAHALRAAIKPYDKATSALLQLDWVVTALLTQPAMKNLSPLFHIIIGNLLNIWRQTAVEENLDLNDLTPFVLYRNELAHAFEGTSPNDLFESLPPIPLATLTKWLTKYRLPSIKLPLISEIAPPQPAPVQDSSSKRPKPLPSVVVATPNFPAASRKKIRKKEKVDYRAMHEESERTANVFAHEIYKIYKKGTTYPFSQKDMDNLIEVMNRPSFDPNTPAVGLVDSELSAAQILRADQLDYYFRLPDGKKFKWRFNFNFSEKKREKIYHYPLQMVTWIEESWLDPIYKALITRNANPNILIATSIPGQMRSITSIHISTFINESIQALALSTRTEEAEEATYQKYLKKIKDYITLVDENGNLSFVGQMKKGDKVIASLASFTEIFTAIITKPEWTYPTQKFVYRFSTHINGLCIKGLYTNEPIEPVTFSIDMPFLTLVMFKPIFKDLNDSFDRKVICSIKALVSTMIAKCGFDKAKVLVEEACTAYTEAYNKHEHLQARYLKEMPDAVQAIFASMIAAPSPTPQETISQETVPPSLPPREEIPGPHPEEGERRQSQLSQIL